MRKFNTSRGEIRVSTPETTAIDLAGYPEYAGGLDQVATILSELAEKIDALALAEAAKTSPIPWIQRLGYMLEFVEAANAAAGIKEYVCEHAREYRMLTPGKSDREIQRLPNWKLIINTDLEPDI